MQGNTGYGKGLLNIGTEAQRNTGPPKRMCQLELTFDGLAAITKVGLAEVAENRQPVNGMSDDVAVKSWKQFDIRLPPFSLILFQSQQIYPGRQRGRHCQSIALAELDGLGDPRGRDALPVHDAIDDVWAAQILPQRDAEIVLGVREQRLFECELDGHVAHHS